MSGIQSWPEPTSHGFKPEFCHHLCVSLGRPFPLSKWWTKWVLGEKGPSKPHLSYQLNGEEFTLTVISVTGYPHLLE